MELKSTEFKDGEPIPKFYTGYGENISPPLSWSEVPFAVHSFALICDDLDASFNHWLIYNMSPNTSHLPEGIPPMTDIDLPIIAMQGFNSFGEVGYSGPKPPKSHDFHHYQFTLYALSDVLILRPGTDRSTLLKSMEPHILATAKLTGTYSYRHYDHLNTKKQKQIEKRTT